MPTPDAAIRLTVSATATTGTYTFNNNLYAGTWEVTASKPGYTPQTATVTVTAGQVTSQSFTLFLQQ